MKRLLLLFTLSLAGSPFCGFSQGVLLKAGDSFSCEFNNLQFQFQVPPGAPYNPLTRLLLGTHNFSGSFLVEAFEDSAAQPPIFSANVSSQAAASDFYFGPAWQDLQGMARVTMLSGSMDLTLLMGTVTSPAIDVYSQSIYPVPEPSSLSLLLVAALPMWYLRRRPRAYSAA